MRSIPRATKEGLSYPRLPLPPRASSRTQSRFSLVHMVPFAALRHWDRRAAICRSWRILDRRFGEIRRCILGRAWPRTIRWSRSWSDNYWGARRNHRHCVPFFRSLSNYKWSPSFYITVWECQGRKRRRLAFVSLDEYLRFINDKPIPPNGQRNFGWVANDSPKWADQHCARKWNLEFIYFLILNIFYKMFFAIAR